MINLNQKLLIVGGKGGVGKTTVASAFAIASARQNNRVLVVDAAGSGGLATMLLPARSDITPGVIKPVKVSGVPLSLLEISTEVSLSEYFGRYVSLPGASSRLLDLGPLARMFDYISRAAPAVKEILTIGKICYEARHGDWDQVIVDGPATGHLVELITAPEALSEIVQVGPLQAQTAWMSEMLGNPKECAAILVATPAELPVSELLELCRRLQNETSTRIGAISVNRVPPSLSKKGRIEAQNLAAGGGGLAPAAAAVLAQANIVETQLERVRATDLPIMQIRESSDPLVAAASVFESSVLDTSGLKKAGPGEERGE